MNQIIENISESLKHTNDLLKSATDNFDNLYKLHIKNIQRYANLLEENDNLLDFIWEVAEVTHKYKHDEHTENCWLCGIVNKAKI